MVRIIAQIKNPTNNVMTILNEKTICLNLIKNNKYFDFDKLYSNKYSPEYIYKKEFENIFNGFNLFFYDNSKKNIEEVTEVLNYIVKKLNYYCEISIIQTNKSTTTDYLLNDNELFVYTTKNIKKTWELITSEEDYQNFKTILTNFELNKNQLIFSFNSPLLKKEINVVSIYCEPKDNYQKYFNNPLDILTDCLDSKKYFYSQNNISIIFKNILKSNNNTIIFFKLDTDKNKDFINILDISSKMLSNKNINNNEVKFIPVKKRRISRHFEDLLLEKKIQKEIQKESFKILKPKFSLKTEDDLPSLRTNNSPKKKLFNINIDDISESTYTIHKSKTKYDYKKNFYTIASLNRFLYDAIIRNQIIIENSFNQHVDKKTTDELKLGLKYVLKFILNELEKI
jgi:hypothetical protein